MHVNGAAKGGGGKNALHFRLGPVLPPVAEKFFLTRPEQLQTGKVHGLRVVGGIVDVIGARSHLRDFAERAALELAIFENGKVHSANPQAGKIHRDAALDGRGIDGIGQVPGLLALHLVHVVHGVEVAPVGAIGSQTLLAVLAPEIAVAHIVIVRDADARTVAQDVAELQAELDPADRVLGVAVGLVPGEEK